MKGGARADWGKRTRTPSWRCKLDESNIQAKVAVANWSQPAVNFDVVADRLNVDRYFPPAKPEQKGASGGAAAGGGAAGGGGGGAAAAAPPKSRSTSRH